MFTPGKRIPVEFVSMRVSFLALLLVLSLELLVVLGEPVRVAQTIKDHSQLGRRQCGV